MKQHILELFKQGKKRKHIAKQLGICYNLVCQIIKENMGKYNNPAYAKT